MKLLIIGGTGAMGAPLTGILSKNTSNLVYVLSRKGEGTRNSDNVRCIKGDAFDLAFMKDLIKRENFDVIIDFMIYNPDTYNDFLELYLNSCKQYVFTSTASVYNEPSEHIKITEETPLLWENYSEERKGNNRVYHILKTNLDNIVLNQEKKNWTMVRPYITFNIHKLPLATWPKECWLYRALNGKSVILPKDVMDIPTTVTYGYDVSVGISELIGNDQAFGQIINIASNMSLTWNEVFKMYQTILKEKCGAEINVKWVDTSDEIWVECPHQYDFLACDRLLRKEFDTKKLDTLVGHTFVFSDSKDSLKKCLETFLDDTHRQIYPDPVLNGYMDRVTSDFTSLRNFKSRSAKLSYLVNRYIWVDRLYKFLRRIKRMVKTGH